MFSLERWTTKMCLKVDSWSFEDIIILLPGNYFLNCQKALFHKEISFSKKYRVKSVRLAVLQGIL